MRSTIRCFFVPYIHYAVEEGVKSVGVGYLNQVGELNQMEELNQMGEVKSGVG